LAEVDLPTLRFEGRFLTRRRRTCDHFWPADPKWSRSHTANLPFAKLCIRCAHI